MGPISLLLLDKVIILHDHSAQNEFHSNFILRGVGRLKIHARNCRDVVNTFMKKKKQKKKAKKNKTSKTRRRKNAARGVSSRSALFAMKHIKYTIKSYMNQDLFHFVNECSMLKGVLEQLLPSNPSQNWN